MEIEDSALIHAARLGSRYIADRRLPDKAVDLIDEAASKVRIEADSLPSHLKEHEQRIQELVNEEEAASQRADYEKAAQLRTERLRLEQEYAEARDEWFKGRKIDMTIDEQDIAKLIELWTGIPTSRLLEEEAEKLLHMEERLHERVIGQEEAVVVVSDAIRRARSGISGPQASHWQLHLPWPHGCGKDRAGPGPVLVPL